MKIDVFAHFVPKKYCEVLANKAEGEGWWFSEEPALSQIDIRLRILDMYPDVTQVLTVATPPLETMVPPHEAIELARLANEEMAEVVAKYPNKFISAVACLPLNDVDAAIKEADRAITKLHFGGVQIFSNINGEPLDSPKFMPLYQRMAQHDLPLWIHPWGKPKLAAGDLLTNPIEGLGWPFETTAAMGCLAQSGVFEAYPNIKFITHHCGGMVPFFARRIANAAWERGMAKVKGVFVLGESKTRIVENMHKFYADTAIYGNSAGLMCGYAYFGADHLLFGTDMPLGREDNPGGYQCTRETILSVEQMDVPAVTKDKIFEGNAKRLLRLEPPK